MTGHAASEDMFEAILRGHVTERPGLVRLSLLALMIGGRAAYILQVVDNLTAMAPDCREIHKVDTGTVRFMARHNQ